jgi:hypothetical protein
VVGNLVNQIALRHWTFPLVGSVPTVRLAARYAHLDGGDRRA